MLNKKHIDWATILLLFTLVLSTNVYGGLNDGSLVLKGNGYVSMESMNTNSQTMTVETWAFKESWQNTERETILSQNAGDSWELFVSGSYLYLKLELQSGPCILQHPVLEAPAGWHHLSFTIDDKFIRFYVDGSQRDYFYSAAGFSLVIGETGSLNVGSKSHEGNQVNSGWNGKIDEVRFWNTALSASEIAQNMHHGFQSGNLLSFENLELVLPFYDNSLTAYMGSQLSPVNVSSGLNYAVVDQSAIIGTIEDVYSFDTEAYWSLYGAGIYSESSGGLHVAISNGNLLELHESLVFGQNGKHGISHASDLFDLDFIACRVWYVDDGCDYESFMFRFDMSDAEAIGILDECLSYGNYKLLFKEESSDSFRIISEGYMLDGDNLFFKDVVVNDGYYTIGRDNEVPAVNTASVADIGSVYATGGGEVTCDGGTPVSKYGLCWSLNAVPTVSDSMSIIGNGIGEFTTQITNLVPGCTYYVRAYAMNQEGVGYGDEMIIKTNKLNQSVVFPAIDPKEFGDAPFDPGAYASSGLPINYRSSNESVAKIIDGMIHITGVGSTSIWANQPGSISYNPSTYRKATLSVSKSAQQLLGIRDFNLHYGDTLCLNEINASSGLSPEFTISDSSLFIFTDDAIIAGKIGKTNCTIVQPGNINYLASREANIQISILKKDVNISLLCDTVVYDGRKQCVIACCDEDSLEVIVTYNESPDQPVIAGTYKVKAMVDDEFYEGADSVIFYIHKAEPIVFNWPMAGELFEGQSLASCLLIDGQVNVPGRFRFSDPDFSPSYSGENVEVIFYPEDTLNYRISTSFIPVYFGIATASETMNQQAIIIYPSVGHGRLTMDAGDLEWSYKIYNLSGRLMYEKTGVKGKSQQDVSFLGKGLFTIVGESEDKRVIMKISIM